MLIFKMRPGGKRARPTSIAACAVLIFMTASGCVGSAGDSAEQTSIAIARQVGLGYAPLVILENKPELVEQYLPGVKIDWNEIGAGTSIRDAVLAGDIDVAAGGAGPVIVGITKGMEISILSGIAEMPMWVVAAPGGPQNLDDFDETDKFATAGLGSSQHVLLNSALDEAGLEPKALEENLVSMGHPDGLSAFLAGQVAAHATSSPFQEREVAAGGIKIVDSFDIWGEHTFQLTYMQRQWVEENPELADGLTEAISAAIDWIETNESEAAQILSDASGGGTSPEEALEQLNYPQLTFSTEIRNIKPMADAMYKYGFIDREVTQKELFFPEANVGSDW